MAKSYVETVRTKKHKDGTEEKIKCILVDMAKATEDELKFIELKGKMGYEIILKDNKVKKQSNGLKKKELLFYLEKEDEKVVKENSDLENAIEEGNFIKIKAEYRKAKFGKISDAEKGTDAGKQKTREITKKFKALETQIKKFYKENYNEE